MLYKVADAIGLYFAPSISLTAVLFMLLSFLSPVIVLPTYASLVVVKPMWHDGPSVFLGLLGTFIGLQILGGSHLAFQDHVHEPVTLNRSAVSTLL